MANLLEYVAQGGWERNEYQRPRRRAVRTAFFVLILGVGLLLAFAVGRTAPSSPSDQSNNNT